MPRTALVTAANGYIGAAVSRAFVRAGYRVYGLIRRASSAPPLAQAEVIPIIGTLDDLSFLDSVPLATVDVIVNCLEAFPDYAELSAKVMTLITKLAKTSNANGVKPLVLWSSGSKDYGTSPLHGDPELAPHTEESPLRPPIEAVRSRFETALRIFDEKYHQNLFDGVVLRPTNVYGYSSSYYAGMLEYAEKGKVKGKDVLTLVADPNTPLHALHVDDCADAYVALAEHHDRAAVAGQAFNIASHRYETTLEVGQALAKEYGYAGGVRFVSDTEGITADGDDAGTVDILFKFPQWVGSDKLRTLTGWHDKRMLWSENLTAYRLAYEAERANGHENIELSLKRLGALRPAAKK
jgi:nucleoside-diphosphate-sugar epimerase